MVALHPRIRALPQHLLRFPHHVAEPARGHNLERGRSDGTAHRCRRRPFGRAAGLAPHVFTAAPGVRLAHATAIGIPLRPAVTGLDRPALRRAARQRFGLRPDGPVLLVTGGSQGARTINGAVSGTAAALRAAGVQVLHITGRQHAVQVPDGGPVGSLYVVIPYVEEMQYAYAAADFAVCRAGAMTCAELAAVGLPAVYVPLPL